MDAKLGYLAHTAREVATIAEDLLTGTRTDHGELHAAMVEYRAAAIAYIAHPSVSEYVKADALKYTGEAREAIERIAELIDQLSRA